LKNNWPPSGRVVDSLTNQEAMKQLVTLFTVAFATGIRADVGPEENPAQVCKNETNFTEKKSEELNWDTYPDDPVIREFTFCLSKKLGYINTNGDLQNGAIKKMLLLDYEDDDDLVDKIINKCSVQKKTPRETTFELYRCLYNGAYKYTKDSF
ncbi:PBP GOBP domain containing protein, partial [Asbolus verrucosus]